MHGMLKALRKLLVIVLILAVIGGVIFYYSQGLLVFPGRGLYTGNTPEWSARVAALAGQGLDFKEYPREGGGTVFGVVSPSPVQPAPGLVWIHGRDKTITEINHDIKPLALTGLNVLAMEYRGYGNSVGETTEANLMADAEASLAFLLTQENIASKRVFVGGSDLGANLALKLSLRKPVEGVIAVSPLPDVALAVAQKIPYIPLGFLLKERYELDPSLASITVPVLVIQGTADTVVPMARVEEIVSKMATRAKLKRVQGAGHDDVFDRGGKDLSDEIDLFTSKRR
jgi:alpha-beta hydrolase superfamily lysophospholipase